MGGGSNRDGEFIGVHVVRMSMVVTVLMGGTIVRTAAQRWVRRRNNHEKNPHTF